MTNLFRPCFVTFFTILSLLKGDMLLHLALSRLNNGVSTVTSYRMASVRARRLRQFMLVWDGIAGLLLLEVVAKFGSLGVFIQSFLFGDTTISGGELSISKVKFQASS